MITAYRYLFPVSRSIFSPASGLATTLLVLLLPLQSSIAQQALFTGMSFEHEVSSSYGYQFEIEHRQLLNTGAENRVLLQGALNFLLSDRFSVTPAVRYTPKYDDDPGTIRLQADFNYDLPLGDGPFTLEGRFRSQIVREVGPGANGQGKVAVRPRLGLALELFKHTELALEYEARYRFDQRNEFARHRTTLGLSQRLSTRLSVELFYRLEREANVTDITTDPTLGIYLGYTLPNDRTDNDGQRRPFGRSLLF